MSIILSQITMDLFVDSFTPECDDAFKVYELVIDGKNATLGYLSSLDHKDKKSALLSFIKLLAFANTGKLLHELFDEIKLHPAHEFKYKDGDKKIWRLWIVGDIRIYYIYLPNKFIVVLNTAPKRKQKLNKSEKEYLEKLAIHVFDCFHSNLITINEGNKNELLN